MAPQPHSGPRQTPRPKSGPAPRRQPRSDPRTDLALAISASASLALVGVFGLELPLSWAALTLGFQLSLSALLLRARPDLLPDPGLGWPNRVTLLRSVGVMPILSLALHPWLMTTGLLWGATVLGTALLLLDGLDGRLARRRGEETDFGARFDMELDAALILALSVIVWWTGPVGGTLGPASASWVLLIGGMRYLFVLAGHLEPRLQRPLPERFRRKLVCVVQGVALLVALCPIVPPVLAIGSVAFALALLVWSFGLDTLWLLRRDPAQALGVTPPGRSSRWFGDARPPSPDPGQSSPGSPADRRPHGWGPARNTSRQDPGPGSTRTS